MMLVMAAIPLAFPIYPASIRNQLGSRQCGRMGAGLGELDHACFLLGLTFCAVGLLISALAESQIVAALLTFAALLLAFVLPMMAGRLDGDWRSVVEYLSPLAHVNRGLQGRVLLADLVYFGTAIGAFLYLTLRVVESHRWR